VLNRTLYSPVRLQNLLQALPWAVLIVALIATASFVFSEAWAVLVGPIDWWDDYNEMFYLFLLAFLLFQQRHYARIMAKLYNALTEKQVQQESERESPDGSQ
jgi:hypothetical protein